MPMVESEAMAAKRNQNRARYGKKSQGELGVIVLSERYLLSMHESFVVVALLARHLTYCKVLGK